MRQKDFGGSCCALVAVVVARVVNTIVDDSRPIEKHERRHRRYPSSSIAFPTKAISRPPSPLAYVRAYTSSSQRVKRFEAGAF